MTLSANHPWVDHASYFGPNRRRGSKSFRLRERRQEDASGPSPSLNAALRKLRMHVFDATPGRKATAFADRVLGAAVLALDCDALQIQVQLEGLARQIIAHPNREWRQAIYAKLEEISIRSYAVH